MMTGKEKELIQLRAKLRFYKKLDKKLQDVLDGKLEIETWEGEVYRKIDLIEDELWELKTEMDLPESEWDEDELSN